MKGMKKMDYVKYVLVLAFFAICGMTSAQSAEKGSDDSNVAKEDVICAPEYKGGIENLYKFIKDNFDYPEDCRKRYVSGTIEMEFTIEKSGEISSVGVLKGLEESVDDELIRVFKAMPMWTPATRNGKPVRYKVSMPVTLKISRSRNGTKSNFGI